MLGVSSLLATALGTHSRLLGVSSLLATALGTHSHACLASRHSCLAMHERARRSSSKAKSESRNSLRDESSARTAANRSIVVVVVVLPTLVTRLLGNKRVFVFRVLDGVEVLERRGGHLPRLRQDLTVARLRSGAWPWPGPVPGRVGLMWVGGLKRGGWGSVLAKQ